MGRACGFDSAQSRRQRRLASSLQVERTQLEGSKNPISVGIGLRCRLIDYPAALRIDDGIREKAVSSRGIAVYYRARYASQAGSAPKIDAVERSVNSHARSPPSLMRRCVGPRIS